MTSGGNVIWLLFAATLCCFMSDTASQPVPTSCLACSYIFGTYDGGCVSNATYFAKTTIIPCNFSTSSCVITAVYEENYAGLISLSRGCQPTTGTPADTCHDMNGQPTCQEFCKGDRCNSEAGDPYARWSFGDNTSQPVPTSCLACSYIFAGHDGTYDRDCVANATYFAKTKIIPCNFSTHSCVITAVYEENYARLLSLSRDCQPTTGTPADRCHDVSSRPSCQEFCKGDRCNSDDGDLHARWSVGDGSSGGMASLAGRRHMVLMMGWSLLCSGGFRLLLFALLA